MNTTMKKHIAWISCLAMSGAVALAACSSSTTATNTTPTDGGGAQEASTIDDAGGTSEGGGDAEPGRLPDGGIAPLSWAFVPTAGAKCRDGSDTGMAVNLNPASKKVLIFLEGGGACFNSITCNGNAAKYGQAEFDAALAKADPKAGFNGNGQAASNGIMSRGDDKNPVKDWNMFYIPYCTGDVHAGNNPAGMIKGVTGPQMFVGYNNVKVDLDAIKAMVPGATDVFLSGMSAGGFGAALNYEQVAAAFDPLVVNMIDDSGPPMEDPYLPECLMQQFITEFGFDSTVVAACGDDCKADGGLDVAHFGTNYFMHLGKKYPKAILGLMDSTADKVIAGQFFAFGAQNCTTYLPTLQSDFTAGLLDVRSKMAFDTNYGDFLFQGQDHTSIQYLLDTRTSGTADPEAGTQPVVLVDWVTQMLAGKASTNGP
jgi:hypothetical protein